MKICATLYRYGPQLPTFAYDCARIGISQSIMRFVTSASIGAIVLVDLFVPGDYNFSSDLK